MKNDVIGKCLLHELLVQSRMTPTDLSVATDISIYQISAYINNKRKMTLTTARIISIALNCHIEDLYEWKK